MTEPLVYRVHEVAHLLKVSRSAIYRGISDGTIPVIRQGRSVRVPAWWVTERTRRVA